jgi:CBS-domain-containing membrane protein
VRLLGTLNPTLLQTPIRDIMSKPLISISIDSSIIDAIQTMHQKNIRRLLVVKREKMVGIITDKDIFRAIMKVSMEAGSCNLRLVHKWLTLFVFMHNNVVKSKSKFDNIIRRMHLSQRLHIYH